MACNHLPSVRCAECQSAGPYLGDPEVAIEILRLRVRELEDTLKWGIDTLEAKTDDIWWARTFATELRKRANMVTIKIDWARLPEEG